MTKKSFGFGAAVLTGAILISKVLGFLFVIPFVALVGENNYILYEYAYKPYALMITLATLGIPGAVSKYVSKYNELGKPEYVKFSFYRSLLLISFFGVISFLALYNSSDFLAQKLVGFDIDNNQSGNAIEDVAFMIKIVSFALLVVPVLSVLRGFMQGNKEMLPSAISQIIEQIVRVLIIIVGAVVVVIVMKKDPIYAVQLSVLAATVSAIAAVIVMLYYFFKSDFKFKNVNTKKVNKISFYKELGVYIVPFIFVGLNITLYQTIDTFTINEVLVNKGNTLKEAETVNAVVSLVQKVIVLPLAIGTALATTLIPFVTGNYFKNDYEKVRENINKAIKINMFFIFPAMAGFLALSKPIYSTIFGTSNGFLGGDIMTWYALAPLAYSLYTITSAILQGIDKSKWIIIAMVSGVVIKLISNKPLIYLMDGSGTAISTYLGLAVSIGIQMYIIQKECKYRWMENIIEIKEVFKQTVVMFVILIPIGLYSLSTDMYKTQLIITVIGVSLGMLVYLLIAKRNETLFEIIKKPGHK